MSKDLKRGIFGLIIIAVLFFAIRTARKAKLFDRDTTIHAVFRSTGGIEEKNDVIINGLRVGTVSKMEPSDRAVSRVKISMKIDRELNIPVNSVAHISPSALSAAKIIIERGDSKTYLSNDDVIATKEEDGALEKLQAEAKPLAQKVQNIADSLSKVLKQYNTKLDAKKQADLRRQINALNAQMAGYTAMMSHTTAQSATYLNNLKTATGRYAAKSDEINKMIATTNKKIAELHKMQPGVVVDSLNEAIASFNRKILGFNSGALGSFTSDRNAYDELNADLLRTELVLDDIRINPKRYLNYSVFGKSSKAPDQTEPEAAKERRRRNAEFNRRQQEQYRN